MNNKLLKLIHEHARELVVMNKAMKDAYEEKIKNSKATAQWKTACEKFHSSYDRLAFPGGLKEGMSQLKKGDAAAIEAAIAFLKVDPYFFRSGYIKEEILHYLSRAVLNEKQIIELQEILLDRLNGEERREFKNYCKLAKKIASEAFIAKVQKNLLSESLAISSRAQRMLKFCEAEAN